MWKLSGFLTLLVADEITAWMPFLLQYVYMSCCCILNMHNGNAYILCMYFILRYIKKNTMLNVLIIRQINRKVHFFLVVLSLILSGLICVLL